MERPLEDHTSKHVNDNFEPTPLQLEGLGLLSSFDSKGAARVSQKEEAQAFLHPISDIWAETNASTPRQVERPPVPGAHTNSPVMADKPAGSATEDAMKPEDKPPVTDVLNSLLRQVQSDCLSLVHERKEFKDISFPGPDFAWHWENKKRVYDNQFEHLSLMHDWSDDPQRPEAALPLNPKPRIAQTPVNCRTMDNNPNVAAKPSDRRSGVNDHAVVHGNGGGW